MTKQELVAAVSAISGHSKDAVEAIINLTLDEIKTSVKNNNPVTLRGFATITGKLRAPKIARNISTGQAVQVPARIVPVIKPAKEFKEMLNS